MREGEGGTIMSNLNMPIRQGEGGMTESRESYIRERGI